MAEFQVRPDDGDMNFHQSLPRRVASSVREYFCYKAYLVYTCLHPLKLLK